MNTKKHCFVSHALCTVMYIPHPLKVVISPNTLKKRFTVNTLNKTLKTAISPVTMSLVSEKHRDSVYAAKTPLVKGLGKDIHRGRTHNSASDRVKKIKEKVADRVLVPP